MPENLFYRTIPALAQYIDRIGAKEKNFRRWMVQEDFGHYYKEKCVVKIIDHEGTIEVTDDVYAPTAAEQAAIRLAFSEGIELPRSIEIRPTGLQDLLVMLRAEHLRLAEVDGDPVFFEFYNQRTGNLLMVQQRIDTDQGKKYLPWCYWSDGLWRCMEPDGDLPFWKPKRATDKTKIMVHEGAKAAKVITELCDDADADHPWIETLREFEHWGMVGGALSPHRADYQELWAREPDLMVYVCDNDWPGRSALEKVSKKYKRKMKGVYFDNRWPSHWDMADPMPRNLFSPAGRYIGDTLQELMRNCTWATEMIPVPNGGKGRPTCVISPHFLQEWAHCRKPEVYVHVDVAREMMSEREFNSWVRPYSDSDDTARVLRRRDAHKASGLCYDPSMPRGWIAESNDVSFINTYVPPNVKAERGDVSIWLEYINNMIIDETDRREVIRWCATLACRPTVKMGYGLLLISETQGVGKSTLGSHVLRPLVGAWNTSEPSEMDVVDSGFNGWSAHKRLAVIHEIYAGHSSKAYDRLKSVITETTLRINEKYQAAYEIENWLHVIACSNSKRALKLSMDDRRWLVPTVSEEKRDPAYWTALREWLKFDGGVNKIKFWFEEWLNANGAVAEGSPAPHTSAKRDMVREGYSPGQEIVANFLTRLAEETTEPVVLLDVDMQRMIKDHIYEGRNTDKLERPNTIRKLAKGEGWHINENALRSGPWLAGRMGRVYVITNDAEVATLSAEQLIERFQRPLDVAQKARIYFGAM